MPPHHIESHAEKTMSFTSQNVFKRKLSRLGDVTAFTQLTTEQDFLFKLKCFFKGKGKNIKITAPDSVKFQWEKKSSCRLKQILKTTSKLPN